jgi:hypothetical protein
VVVFFFALFATFSAPGENRSAAAGGVTGFPAAPALGGFGFFDPPLDSDRGAKHVEGLFEDFVDDAVGRVNEWEGNWRGVFVF